MSSTNKMMKFCDFPCMYYMASRTDRQEQIRFFGALAAMFGLTIDSAASSSELFAHASGGVLFQGVGIKKDELQGIAKGYFEKPYNSCKSFYRHTIIRNIGMMEHCCVLCPLSGYYKNNRILEERHVLRSILDGITDAFSNNLTADCFFSYISLSGSNDISRMPAVKLHSWLFEFLLQHLPECTNFNKQELNEYIYSKICSAGYIPEMEYLARFVEGQLKLIQSVTPYSLEIAAVSMIRLITDYIYKPEKLVFPNSSKEKSCSSKKLVQLNLTAFPLLAMERALSEQDAPTTTISKSAVPVSSSGIDGSNTIEDIPTSTSDVLSECSKLLPDSSSGKKKRNKKHKIYHSVPAKLTYNIVIMLNHYRKHFYMMHHLLPYCIPTPESALALLSDPCDACHQFRSFLRYHDYQNSSRRQKSMVYLSLGCYQYACSPFNIKTKGYKCIEAGCLFNAHHHGYCYYTSTPNISETFMPYIINCSSSLLANVVDFTTEACNCQHISLEYVCYDGVYGILFFINGKFYFFNPYYETSGFLKPLLADASLVRFYSINPIPVLACLYSLGFKGVRIESVGAFYSTAIGLPTLLPISLMFQLNKDLLHMDYFVQTMPQYPDLFKKSFTSSISINRKKYEVGLRLEWALATSYNLESIAKGVGISVKGGNYLDYHLTFHDLGALTEKGTLYVAKLRNSKNISGKDLLIYWEDVAGRIATSSLKFVDYSFLLALSRNGITYYCTYDVTHFYDVLLDVIRAAYREYFTGMPDVVIECEQFS